MTDPYGFLARLCGVLSAAGVIGIGAVFVYYVRQGRMSTHTHDTNPDHEKDETHA